MRILFIRHAEAEEVGHGIAGADESRRLTRKGRRQSKELGHVLETLGVRPRVLFSSPLLRTMQTSELLLSEMRRSPGIVPVTALEPGGGWAALKAEVARHGARLAGRGADTTWVFVVGHQPDLGKMVMSGLGCGGNLELKKGACIGLGWPDDNPEGVAVHICLALDQEAVKNVLGVRPHR